MSLINIPAWLEKRPINRDDFSKDCNLIFDKDTPFFSDITIEKIKEFHTHNSGNLFYKLVRILGFYGVVFGGKLENYSGTKELTPDLIYVESCHFNSTVQEYLNELDNLSTILYSYGIRSLKQLHGIPVISIIKISNIQITPADLQKILPVSVVNFNDNFFDCLVDVDRKENTTPEVTQSVDITELLSRNVTTLNFSVRTSRCLRRANINNIGELIKKHNSELLSIKNFGQLSLNEVKKKLSELMDMGTVYNSSNLLMGKQHLSVLHTDNSIDFDSKDILDKLSKRIDEFNVSKKCRELLISKKIEYIWQLIGIDKNEIINAKYVGKQTLNEIIYILKSLGFTLGIKVHGEQFEKLNKFRAEQKKLFYENWKSWLQEIVKSLSIPNNKELVFLKNVEKAIIYKRNFNPGIKKTLEEIATEFGVTRERIRQHEKNAAKKIKRRYSYELEIITDIIVKKVESTGGATTLLCLSRQLCNLTAQEQEITSYLLNLSNKKLFINWKLGLVDINKGNTLQAVSDKILKTIKNTLDQERSFTHMLLQKTVKNALVNLNITIHKDEQFLISSFFRDNCNITNFKGNNIIGNASTQEKVILAFKHLFPQGLDVHKNQKELLENYKEYDSASFQKSTPRSIIARLTDHPNIFLWDRGFYIHKDFVSYKIETVEKIIVWIKQKLNEGLSRFNIELVYNEFKEDLNNSNIPTPYALYTLIRLLNDNRIGQRKYPTIVDNDSDIDINEGVLESIESFMQNKECGASYSELKMEFMQKRGWKEYSLSMNLFQSELIFPLQRQEYIHIDYLNADEVKLEELNNFIRSKLSTIKGAYNLKGAQKEKKILWEQACPSASVRTMIKLITWLFEDDDIEFNRNFVSLKSNSNNDITAVSELESLILETKKELSFADIKNEFLNKRGWPEHQIYTAKNKSTNILQSGPDKYIHKSLICHDGRLLSSTRDIMKEYLDKTNNNGDPHMQIENIDIIHEYKGFPALPENIYWNKYLTKSIGNHFEEFIIFDNAYIANENSFDIEDLDDMIAYLIAKKFKLGIASREKIEEVLYAEGILNNNTHIPDDQFFDGSSIVCHNDSQEIGLSDVGREKYGD